MASSQEKTPVMTTTRIGHVNDHAGLPVDYSSTPGGTLYSTTPGGTRIVYDRSFLMHLKNSPISQTPPKNLSAIPTSIHKDTQNHKSPNGKRASPPNNKGSPEIEETEQFQMDM